MKRVAPAIAALCALIPGFILPFAISQSLPPHDSDLFLLTYGAAATMIAIVGPVLELTTVSEVGRLAGPDAAPHAKALSRYRNRAVRFAIATVAIVAVALSVVYSFSTGDPWVIIPMIAMASLIPIINAPGSVASGVLIALGRSSTAVALQAPRAAVPLVALHFLGASISGQYLVAALIAAAIIGELIRWAASSFVLMRIASSSETHEMKTTGMAWQASSAAVSQGGPVTDRAFLTQNVGAITAYEAADKIYFAMVQVINYGAIVRMMGRWAMFPRMSRPAAASVLAQDGRKLALAATAFILGTLITWALLRDSPIPPSWRLSVDWAALLMASLPFTLVIMIGGRLLIIGRMQSLLFRISLVTVGLNAILDLVFYAAAGSIGIIIATVCMRIIIAATYITVVWRNFRKIASTEMLDQ